MKKQVHNAPLRCYIKHKLQICNPGNMFRCDYSLGRCKACDNCKHIIPPLNYYLNEVFRTKNYAKQIGYDCSNCVDFNSCEDKYNVSTSEEICNGKFSYAPGLECKRMEDIYNGK